MNWEPFGIDIEDLIEEHTNLLTYQILAGKQLETLHILFDIRIDSKI